MIGYSSGDLERQIGEGDAAADAYRNGLLLVSQPTLPAIPHIPEPADTDVVAGAGGDTGDD